MESLLPLGVLMATTTAVVYLSFRGARAWSQNALAQEHRLLMKATMASYGITSIDVVKAGRADEFEAARQVCDRCHSIEQCLGHLAAHRRDGFEAFCPNAALWQDVHDWKRSAA